jgi:histidyl-tRNA synthetase
MARANALLDEAAARGLEREKIFAILLGSREREAGTVTIKKLASGEQETLPQRDVAAWLAGRM